MGETQDSRYWCHLCSQMVNPVMEVEIKCPFCQSGFVEEMDGGRRGESPSDPSSERALSLWGPFLLGMLGGSSRTRTRREVEEDQDRSVPENDRDQDRDSDEESLVRRRRRRSVAILQLLNALRSENTSEPENSEGERERGERDPEHLILINPFSQTLIIQESHLNPNSNSNSNSNQNIPGALGDYFIGSGLDLLLQQLADSDPSRYGTPPAKKEAIEAMPTVKIGDELQCSVCLDDFEIGCEAKEMPCKHRFHGGCILPWLELHSSCPVCRFQLPAAEIPKESNGSGNSGSWEGREIGEEGSNGGNTNSRNFWVSVPWPFNGLFSSSGSRNGRSSESTPSATPDLGNGSQTDEN